MSSAAFEDRKISFFSKESTACPVCGCEFHREEILSGGGRLIAGNLTDELHREYDESAKYGRVYPLSYPVTVCPECWYASLEKDFPLVPQEQRMQILEDAAARKEEAAMVFPPADFSRPRGLAEGAASHFLAVKCYDYFPKEFSPTIKQGISALRAGWLLDDLHKLYPDQNFDWAAVLFKKKAQFFYTRAMAMELSREEPLSGIKNFGPDTDKNYGYEGALYVTALLELKYGQREDSARRRELLGQSKRNIAKIFGLGRTSKNKPGPLLEHARNLYDNINKDLNETDD